MLRVEKHFLAKLPGAGSPIAEGKQVGLTLEALLLECDNRLNLFSKAAVKNSVDYNDRFVNRLLGAGYICYRGDEPDYVP